jgi:hypothetical protein
MVSVAEHDEVMNFIRVRKLHRTTGPQFEPFEQRKWEEKAVARHSWWSRLQLARLRVEVSLAKVRYYALDTSATRIRGQVRPGLHNNNDAGEQIVNNADKDKTLRLALRVFGVIFLLVYPLGLIWPSGWVWHHGEGVYYLQMIAGIYAVLGIFLIIAAKNPAANRSLISFTVWSSVVHALIMAVQALGDKHETGHLMGDVPALVLVAAVLWYLSPVSGRTLVVG